jgi:hypothetical protein
MLRVSTHWLRDGTSVNSDVGGYVEKYANVFFQVRTSRILRLICICDLFTLPRASLSPSVTVVMVSADIQK